VLEHRAEVLLPHVTTLACNSNTSPPHCTCRRRRNAIFADMTNSGSIDRGLGEAEDDYTFRSVKRRSLRRPARWRASCAACVSLILEVGAAGAEEEAAESCRDRLRAGSKQ
jgi:hypothetical protein